MQLSSKNAQNLVFHGFLFLFMNGPFDYCSGIKSREQNEEKRILEPLLWLNTRFGPVKYILSDKNVIKSTILPIVIILPE